jgi:hypothetical protein
MWYLCRLYGKLPEENTYGMKCINFFGALCPSLNPSVNLLPTNSPTDQKLPTRVFQRTGSIREPIDKILINRL